MTTGGEDRLSELSDDLLQRILYFLPSKEAASTSLLSRRWGTLWRSSGAVNLAVQVHGYRHLEYGAAYHEAEKAFLTKRDAFVRGAKAALDAAEGPIPITRLTLRVEAIDIQGFRTIDRFLRCSKDWVTGAVDLLDAVVTHPAARHVEELRVAAVDVNNFYLYMEEENHQLLGIYGLISLLASETLRVLDLTRCDVSALMATGAICPLPRLATLRLRYCSVYTNVLQALLDAATELSTVQLESLVFESPPGSKLKPQQFQSDEAEQELQVLRLSFPAATTTLVLVLCGMPEEDLGDCCGWSKWVIEINALRLQSFKYKGLMRPFILRSAPAPGGVAQVDLHFLQHKPSRYHQYDSDKEKATTRTLFWQFLHNFTNARTLKLKVGDELKNIAVTSEAKRARLLCAFPRVQHLELEGIHGPKSKTAAVAIANLLHCCPVLGDIVMKLSNVTARLDKDTRYASDFLERKNRSDYTKSMDRFVRRRWRSKTAMSVEGSSFGGRKYDDVPGIPGLTGRSFACLQRTLRRVQLQFRLDNSSMSSCLGLRLIKFFADHARVLEEISVDTGNRRLDEHLNLNVETQVALAPKPISTTASIQHKNAVGFTVLPLQRQEKMECKL